MENQHSLHVFFMDLIRETIERPSALVDVSNLPAFVEEREDGSLLIGAATTHTAPAEHRIVRTRYPMLRLGSLSQPLCSESGIS